jgi:uncharacterized coiled-coil protein SlyX
MSIQINDGGPAFPVVFQHDEATSECYGISIRDYFAAAALQGNLIEQTVSNDEVAKYAYSLADAMLKAQAAFDEYSHDRSIEEIQKKLTDANQHVTELENRLRALWDKLEGERKYYNEHIRQLEIAGNAMYDFINPPSPSMRTTRMDNLLQGWDDAKIGKEAKL